MAALYGKHTRSLVEKGFCILSNRFPWSHRLTALDAPCVEAAHRVQHSRSLRWSWGSTLMTAKTDAQKTNESFNIPPEEPEYIPKRKAKNPMVKIGYAWMIGLPSGIIGFLLAKREVDKNRLKQLKIRQRMKKSNEGEYDSERYGSVSKAE
uniref:Si:ch73-71c20.5 n=1 Tax=Paramormyrops kingsleyae TaxID=1676925 RepID=A0A3B3SH11_9TELE